MRQAPVWLLATYSKRVADTGVLLGALDGDAFRLLPQDNGVRADNEDGFVFDPRRGVFVHFARTAEPVEVEGEPRARFGLRAA